MLKGGGARVGDAAAGSPEVQRALPEPARRFQEIDNEVRAFLAAATDTRNVLKVCCQPGLLPRLDRLQVHPPPPRWRVAKICIEQCKGLFDPLFGRLDPPTRRGLT